MEKVGKLEGWKVGRLEGVYVMKWDKSLKILLVIFGVMNIFLAYSNYKKYIQTYELSKERVEAITTLLQEEQIEVNGELPRSFLPIKNVWLEPFVLDATIRNALVRSLLGQIQEGITISRESNENPYEMNYLVYRKDKEKLYFKSNELVYNKEGLLGGKMTQKEVIIHAEDFIRRLEMEKYFEKTKRIVTLESYGGRVTYYEVYNGLPLFDSFVELEITPEGVRCGRLRATQVVEKESRLSRIRPIDQVLFEGIDLIGEQRPIVIDSIELGYRMKSHEGKHILEEEAVLVYKIKISSLSEPVFVNAYTK